MFGASGMNENVQAPPAGYQWVYNDENANWRLIPTQETIANGPPVYVPPPTATELETERQNELIGQINTRFHEAGRNEMYDSARSDVFGVQRSRLDERRQTAQRGLGFSLASRGLTGGSADIDANAQEGRSYTDGVINAFSGAEGVANDLRANDERTRLNLIQQVRSGDESLASTEEAFANMRLNAQAARSQANYDAADRYAAQAGNIYQNYQVNQGINQARQQYGGTSIYGVPRSTSGTIAR